MKHFIVASIVLIAALAGAPAHADFSNEVRGALQRGDYATALRELRILAKQGDVAAQLAVGGYYHLGLGVQRDYAEAAKWFRLAAEQGDPKSQTYLGVMYDNGLGVREDKAEAAKWYRRAAEQGDHKSQSNFGIMYVNGQGVPQDYVLAHMWFNLAAAGGDAGGVQNRDYIARRMTPAQIAEGQRLAREWKPRK